MIAAIIFLATAVEGANPVSNPWLDAGLLAFFGTAAGIVGAVITAKIKSKEAQSTAELIEEAKLEVLRTSTTYQEIERLRGDQNRRMKALEDLSNEHLKDLQIQITGLKDELKAEKEYTDELRDHIYEKKDPPPPRRRRVGKLETRPIDLTKTQATLPSDDPHGTV